MSPEMTLNSVVFPAPLGPRMARLSPGATSRSTSRTASRPPNRRPTPRKRRIGPACSVVTPSTACYPPTTFTGVDLPSHGRLFFSQPGKLRPGAGVEPLNVPPNVWSTFGMADTVLTASLPSLV